MFWVSQMSSAILYFWKSNFNDYKTNLFYFSWSRKKKWKCILLWVTTTRCGINLFLEKKLDEGLQRNIVAFFILFSHDNLILASSQMKPVLWFGFFKQIDLDILLLPRWSTGSGFFMSESSSVFYLSCIWFEYLRSHGYPSIMQNTLSLRGRAGLTVSAVDCCN